MKPRKPSKGKASQPARQSGHPIAGMPQQEAPSATPPGPETTEADELQQLENLPEINEFEKERRPRSEKVPRAADSLSANAGTSGAFGQIGRGLGRATFGQNVHGLARATFGQIGRGLARTAGEVDPPEYVTNGSSGPVRYTPSAFISEVRWGGSGLGCLPDVPDCQDHAVYDDSESGELRAFYKELVGSVVARSKLSDDYKSPFKPRLLRQAFRIYQVLRGRRLTAQELHGLPDYLTKAYTLLIEGELVQGTGQPVDGLLQLFAAYKSGATPARLPNDDRHGRVTKAELIDGLREAFCREVPYRNLGSTGYLTAVENQGEIGACTAHAVVGLAEYLIQAATYETIDLSRLFLYKMTRNLMKVSGDTGGYLRTTIKAMASVGIPPETWWGYATDLLDTEPPPFPYAIAANFKALTYKRIDDQRYPPEATLLLLLHILASGFPVAFGFPVYRSISEVRGGQFVIPVPGTVRGDKLVGGHAVLAVGYDSEVEYVLENNRNTSEPKMAKGALIIKNSWGEEWGDGGFAYLPFAYVLKGLAVDFWTIFNSSWISEKKFEDSQK